MTIIERGLQPPARARRRHRRLRPAQDASCATSRSTPAPCSSPHLVQRHGRPPETPLRPEAELPPEKERARRGAAGGGGGCEARASAEAPAAAEQPRSGAAPSPSPEVTLRALVVGGGIGVVLAAANVVRGAEDRLHRRRQHHRHACWGPRCSAWSAGGRPRRCELNVVQTVASSAAVMSFAAGVSAPIPALAMAGQAVSPACCCVWGLALAVVGIALAAWLRRAADRLRGACPFPPGRPPPRWCSAVAAGRGRAAAGRLLSLGVAVALAAAVTWLRDGRLARDPAAPGSPPSPSVGVAAGALTLGVSASPLLLSTGILVGPRVALSMVLGAVIAWGAAAPPPPCGPAWRPTPATPSLVPILLWPGLALLVTSALTTLALAWRALRPIHRATCSRRFADRATAAATARRGSAASPTVCSRLAPGDAVAVAGGRCSSASWPSASPLLLLLALLPVALLLSAASARAAGETDQAPVGQVGVGGAAGAWAARAWCRRWPRARWSSGVATQTAQTLWAFKAGPAPGRLAARAAPRPARRRAGRSRRRHPGLRAGARRLSASAPEPMPAPGRAGLESHRRGRPGCRPVRPPPDPAGHRRWPPIAGVLLTLLERRLPLAPLGHRRSAPPSCCPAFAVDDDPGWRAPVRGRHPRPPRPGATPTAPRWPPAASPANRCSAWRWRRSRCWEDDDSTGQATAGRRG